MPINVDWLPFVLGALFQLTLPTTWDGVDVPVEEMQARATDLLDLFASAGPCMQFALRYTPGCQLQQSTDGGSTWTNVSGWLEHFPACVAQYVAASGRLVMSDTALSPPIPLWDESGIDWIYEG